MSGFLPFKYKRACKLMSCFRGSACMQHQPFLRDRGSEREERKPEGREGARGQGEKHREEVERHTEIPALIIGMRVGRGGGRLDVKTVSLH